MTRCPRPVVLHTRSILRRGEGALRTGSITLTVRSWREDPEVAINYRLSHTTRGYELVSSSTQSLAQVKADKSRTPYVPPPEVRVSPKRKCTVRMNRTTASCECYDHMALRLFDPDHKYVWEDQRHIVGVTDLIVVDLSFDGIDEIIAIQQNHGGVRAAVFSRPPGIHGLAGPNATHR